VASLFKPTVATYCLIGPEGLRSFRTADGTRITKDTPGAVKVERLAKVWYGKYRDAHNRKKRVKLCANKEAAKEILAKLVTDAAKGRHGLGNSFEAHHKRPLADHLEDFRRWLEARGNTLKQVQLKIGRIRRLLDGCKFTFIADLSASRVQEFLADLRETGRRLAALDPGKEWYTLEELATALGLKKTNVCPLVRRHGLEAVGKGRARRFPQATVLALHTRLSRGSGTQTSAYYLREAKSFCRWLVRDRRTPENPLAHLQGGNVKLDRRHDRRELAHAEVGRLIAAALASQQPYRGLTGVDRAILYAAALGTGFRSSELASLHPEAFELESDLPTVKLEAAHAKNRQEVIQPLPRGLAEPLRTFLAGKPTGRPVWPGTWPAKGAEMIRLDLEDARQIWLADAQNAEERARRKQSDFLAYRDADGRVADFHALRHTFISNLAHAGVHPKTAQGLARHSTITLTLDRYSHVGLFDLAGALDALPSILPAPVEPRREVLAATGTARLEPPTRGFFEQGASSRLDRALTAP